jgi:lipopolysaccharide biosynthesis protein
LAGRTPKRGILRTGVTFEALKPIHYCHTIKEPAAARAIAFYLPQFYPIEENDAWWGPGFTEWTNTAKAKPLFPGHRQPHLPADLGFYDLRLPEVQEAQAALAEDYGIEAFCYWHYWFAGRRVLERPMQQLLANRSIHHPFCVAWANQTWSGIWHAAKDRILIEQTYPGPDDDRAHFEYLLPAFLDDRYLRVHGKPLLYLYRPEELPNAAQFVELWQNLAAEAGLEGLYLVAEVSDLLGSGATYTRAEHDGFDAAAFVSLPAVITPLTPTRIRFESRLLRWPRRYRYAPRTAAGPTGSGGALFHPCLFPNWDNTPRSGRRGLVLTGSAPEVFRHNLRATISDLSARGSEDRLMFIKSWNEWAEGNYLEPDLEYGTGYLEVVRQELTNPVE